MTSRGRTILGWGLIAAAIAVLAVFAYQRGTYDSRLNRWDVAHHMAMANFTIPPPMPQKPSLWSYGLAAAGLAVGGIVTLTVSANNKGSTVSGSSSDTPIGTGPDQ